MHSPVTNILLVGVGGQGTVLAGKLLAQVALDQGQDVKVSEIHGMSQRGGSVVTQVRFGAKVYSPVIARGTADAILAFEKLEALRWLSYLKPGGAVIVNDQSIDPLPVITGSISYPQDVIQRLCSLVPGAIVVDALDIAARSGNIRSVNVVLLGILAQQLGIDSDLWLSVIAREVRPHTLDSNRRAFLSGFSVA